MDLDIRGLRVLVTAGAAGIGLEIARSFVREGAKVHVCDIDAAALEALAETDPALTRTVADVADRQDVDRLFEEVERTLGGLDVLVNNAGISGPTGRVDEIDPEDWDRTLAVDLTGAFNCVRRAVRLLAESSNASIINLSSAAGRLGFPLRTPYAAAKWGVVGLTKSLSMELGPMGIRVNAILPGTVDGDRVRRVIASKAEAAGVSFEAMQDNFLARMSLKELIDPQMIADQIVFLCSPRGRATSGQAISVCGDLQSLA